MISTEFQYLAESYPRADSTELTRVARDYEYRRGKEILDIAAIAADVSVDSILNLQLEPEKNKELWEAFGLFTKKDPAILQHLSPGEVMGYLNGVKGKYFEVLVRNRLNDGQQLGDVGHSSTVKRLFSQSLLPNQDGI